MHRNMVLHFYDFSERIIVTMIADISLKIKTPRKVFNQYN